MPMIRIQPGAYGREKGTRLGGGSDSRDSGDRDGDSRRASPTTLPTRSIEINPVVFGQGDDRLLPVPHAAGLEPMAAALAAAVLGADVGDLHVKERLDGGLDLGLRGQGVDLEGVGV